MFCPSDVLLASVPMPRRTPASSSAREGATPEPSRRLLIGLCTTPTPAAARREMSSESSQMPCAALTQHVQRLKMRDKASPVLLVAQHRLRLALCEMRLQQDVVFLGKPCALERSAGISRASFW